LATGITGWRRVTASEPCRPGWTLRSLAESTLYTDKKDWAAITGNCQSGSNATCENDLITLPLWDEEKGKYVGSDGTSYCGDGIPGLVPFKPYPYGWQTRIGDQYDFGIFQSGSDDFQMNAPAMGYDDENLPPGTCSNNTLFDVVLDFDFFDPSLFQ
jgi:hypothetical protein